MFSIRHQLVRRQYLACIGPRNKCISFLSAILLSNGNGGLNNSNPNMVPFSNNNGKFLFNFNSNYNHRLLEYIGNLKFVNLIRL